MTLLVLNNRALIIKKTKNRIPNSRRGECTVCGFSYALDYMSDVMLKGTVGPITDIKKLKSACSLIQTNQSSF